MKMFLIMDRANPISLNEPDKEKTGCACELVDLATFRISMICMTHK